MQLIAIISERLIGQYIWNRSKWIKNPDTGKRKRIKRPDNEWIIVDMQKLRIIPQELWDKVKVRQNEIRKKSANLRKVLNNPKTRSRTGKYIFSGLLKCGCCGASYTMCSTTSYEKAKTSLDAATSTKAALTTTLPEAAKRYRKLVSNLGTALESDISHARGCLESLLGA